MPEEEWFTCPSCKLETKVAWSSGQAAREIDCIHCRRTEYMQVVKKDENGTDVLDDNGKPFLMMTNAIVGEHYSVERGKGRADG